MSDIVKSNTVIVSAPQFNQAQLNLIKQQIMPGASDLELEFFISVCRHTGLDPFSKQIYAIKRRSKDARGNWVEKWVPQCSIDGFRAVAESSGAYAGSDEPVFTDDKDGKPIKATVTIYKMVQGQRCPFVAAAYWDEYLPAEGQDKMWQRMPRTMLSKCAEALALRKAFSTKLGGVYTADEMQQAIDLPVAQVIQKPSPQPLVGSASPSHPATLGSNSVEGTTLPDTDELKNKIHDLLFELGGNSAETIGKLLSSITAYNQHPGITDPLQINYNVRQGKKMSQAQVVYGALKKMKEAMKQQQAPTDDLPESFNG